MRTVKEVGADAISHGATGKGNDQVRFELGAYHFDPGVTIIAPWREWDLKSRTDCIAYADEHGIAVTATVKKPYSMDRNLLHLSFEGGILEDPWAEPPKEMFILTKDPEDAPDESTYLEIGFEQGTPISVDGRRLSPAALLGHLNAVAGANGVGRVDLVENRFVGMKSRGVYETPGGTVLIKAHRAIESLTLDREQVRIRDGLIP
jgi:argininosuccinate synthase